MIQGSNPMLRYAFSLVELSIVLVILGLLTGGILTGQSLIRAAELRSVVTEYQRFQTATQTFRDKYFALPGDMRNATSFWGTAAACPGTHANPATDSKTCDGNGDGNITWTGTTYNGEDLRFWQQLANAGLIEGNYTGARTNGTKIYTAGENIPLSKLSRASWVPFWPTTDATGHSALFASGGIVYEGLQHYFRFGMETSASWNYSPVTTAEEAWNIDTKIDDGLPGRGRMKTYNMSALPNCPDTNDPLTAKYQLSNSAVSCAFLIRF